MRKYHTPGFVRRCLFVTTFFGAASASAVAQQILGVIDGPIGAKLNWVEPIGDADGDGRPDLFTAGLSAPAFQGSFSAVYSSATLLPIWETSVAAMASSGQPCGGAQSVVLGDFDGNGTDDVAVGCPGFSGNASEVFILDGLTGLEVTRIANPIGDFGIYLGAPGDTNGDGFADLIIADRQGNQIVHLGPSGAVAYSLAGPDNSFLGAGEVGDLDFDGASDFALGWGGSGLVNIHSGRTGSLLGSVCVFGPGSCGGVYGFNPVALGDTNGDLVPDFALSSFNVSILGANGGVGLIRTISGADFSTLHQVTGRPLASGAGRDFLGNDLGGGHDINGDGVNDIVGTTGYIGASSVFSAVAVSGKTGQMLFQARPPSSSGSFNIGFEITNAETIPDINGDGIDDWTMSNFSANFGGTISGRVMILAGSQGDVFPVCDAQPNSTGLPARIHLYGAITEFSRGLEIQIDSAVPSSVALIVYGLQAAATPFGDGTLCIDPQGLIRYGGALPLDATGSLRRDVDWGQPVLSQGATAWLAGSSWTVQGIFRDAGAASGFNTTNAIEVMPNR
ncbi:MAG: hypothetical protein ACJAZN_003499 [Planctomycetota bacterium]|jgi:hypothetical protein